MNTKRVRNEERRAPISGRISRRGFLRLGGVGLAGAGLLGVAACGGGGGGQGSGSAGNGLVIGYDQEPPTLNPLLSGADQATNNMVAGILDSPLQILPDLSYAPELAEGMPEVVSEEPFVIQYRFRKGLTWSDGEPLTSEDARFTYEQIVNPDNNIITRQGWQDVKSFETPDERTVRITFSQPYAPWRDLLSNSFAVILPKHIYEGKDFNKALNNKIVGSGPFRHEEWNKGQNLSLVKNENYWGDSPKLDRLTFRFIPDTNTLNASLESGEVQFINPPPDIGLRERLEGFEGVTVKTAAGAEWEHVAFNLEKVPNLKLRQAIAYGIDRERILQEILPGQVEPLDSVLVPQQERFYVPAWKKYAFDADRARRLADEAKAEGADATITFSTTTGNQLRETLQQVVQQQLKKIGIEVEIKNTASGTLFGEWLPEGNFEAGEWAWLATADPSLTILLSANAMPPDGYNSYRYRDEEVTRLIEESDVTVDEARRADLLRQIQEKTAEDLPLIPMYQRPVTYAYAEGLSGPEVNPSLAGPFWNIQKWALQ